MTGRGAEFRPDEYQCPVGRSGSAALSVFAIRRTVILHAGIPACLFIAFICAWIPANIPVIMKQVIDTMPDATGVDLSEIMRAGTFDAKVNHNINVSCIPDVSAAVENRGVEDSGSRNPGEDAIFPAEIKTQNLIQSAAA